MIPNAYFFGRNWYYVTTPQSLLDLRLHGSEITYLIPFWFSVNADASLEDQADQETIAIARQYDLPMLALVNNLESAHTPVIHNILTNRQLRCKLIANITDILFKYNFTGVNIDFEFVPPADRPYLTLFMAELYHALHGQCFLVTMSVPAKTSDDPTQPFSGAYDYRALARYTDQMQLMTYDEHFAEPGPIASIGFVERVLDYAQATIPRYKIRLGMAVYGYEWTSQTAAPRGLAYEAAISLAEEQGVQPRYDYEAQEWTYTFTVDGVLHTVWFEDVYSFYAKLKLALQRGIPGIVIWRMGLEDPRIWELLRKVQFCCLIYYDE